MERVKSNMSRFQPAAFFLAALTAFAAFLPAQIARAVDIQTVVSDKGIKALLVEDYAVPLVSLSFRFVGGSTQDAVGKEGTGRLLSSMLDEGSGDRDSRAMQNALDDNGMEYRFSVGSDAFTGSMRTISDVADESFALMRDMLNNPRFDAEPMERIKIAIGNQLKAAKTNANSLASKAWRDTVYGDHPYQRPTVGTEESLPAITKADLQDFHRRVLARDNLVIGVVGAISAEKLKAVLDQIFGDLPEKAQLTAVPEAKMAAEKSGTKVHVNLDTPQTTIRMALPGLKRDHPDFYTAYLVNHTLGGGAFSSRLYKEVREKRGLTYGVYSYMSMSKYSGLLGAGSATAFERSQQTIDVMKAEIARMGKEGPTAEELALAKSDIINGYAIANLDTSSKIASVLVAIQRDNLGLDYITKRADYMGNVTLEDAKRVARELYSKAPLVITVGREPKT